MANAGAEPCGFHTEPRIIRREDAGWTRVPTWTTGRPSSGGMPEEAEEEPRGTSSPAPHTLSIPHKRGAGRIPTRTETPGEDSGWSDSCALGLSSTRRERGACNMQRSSIFCVHNVRMKIVCRLYARATPPCRFCCGSVRGDH